MKHSTCIVIRGNGGFVVRQMDMFSDLGWTIHLSGRPRWWAESLCNIPEG